MSVDLTRLLIECVDTYRTHREVVSLERCCARCRNAGICYVYNDFNTFVRKIMSNGPVTHTRNIGGANGLDADATDLALVGDALLAAACWQFTPLPEKGATMQSS